MTTTDYTKPVTLIRLTSPAHHSVVEFAYTPRYSRWTVLKYSPVRGQTAMDAWGNCGQSDLANPEREHTVTHGSTTLGYAELQRMVGHLCLSEWIILEHRPYNGPCGHYECTAADTAFAVEHEKMKEAHKQHAAEFGAAC